VLVQLYISAYILKKESESSISKYALNRSKVIVKKNVIQINAVLLNFHLL